MPFGEPPPPPPRDCFGRDELIEKVVRLAENFEPFALIGPGGIGKTSIALTILYHDRIEERFGENRRFIRCDQFPATRVHFLAQLSKAIGGSIENPGDLTPLRPLLSSRTMFIILDNAESILDPNKTGAKEVYSLVDELCQFKTLCLCITSRIPMVPPRFQRPEIPALSIEAARDIFYGVYGHGGRSSAINNLLSRLDFHALSIKLLAATASHNAWDLNRLAKEWGAQRAWVLQTDYHESLVATIDFSLSSPTFRSLGPDARDLLGVVAFFPQGINDDNLHWLFPTIPNRNHIFHTFHALSLTYRNNGFTAMLTPIRDHLNPQDPQSSPLLCTTRDRYFTRLSVDVHPTMPGFEEARWIVLEHVNVEHLLDVFTPTDRTRGDIWDVCYHFMEHLAWHKPRPTILESKIKALADTHPSKPKCLSRLSRLFEQVGISVERKRILTDILELERRRGNDAEVAYTLAYLSLTNRLLGLDEEGLGQVKEAWEIFKRINDTRGLVLSSNGLAWALFNDNQLDAAEDVASSAIDLVLEEGQEPTLCNFHQVLGLICGSGGEKEKAIHHFKMALRIASGFNWRDEPFWNHYWLAKLFRDEGEFENANSHLEQAQSYAVDIAYCQGCAMYMQASVWHLQHRVEDAELEALHALEIFERLGAVKDVEECRDLLQKIEQTTATRSASFRR